MIEIIGGPDRDRTDDLFHAMEARSQLRHRPTIASFLILVESSGFVKPLNCDPGAGRAYAQESHRCAANPLAASPLRVANAAAGEPNISPPVSKGWSERDTRPPAAIQLPAPDSKGH